MIDLTTSKAVPEAEIRQAVIRMACLHGDPWAAVHRPERYPVLAGDRPSRGPGGLDVAWPEPPIVAAVSE